MVLALISIFLSLSGFNYSDPFIDIMTLLSRFSPAIMLLLIFSVFIRTILKQVLSIVPERLRTLALSYEVPFDLSNVDTNKENKVIFVTSVMALSIFVILIPRVDGQQHQVAEDTTVYARWLEPMKDCNDISDLLRLAFVEIRGATTGDRLLSLLILNGLFQF
ncbi:MAG: hypothetical protein ACRD8W_12985 [Nitrososphaeraceae archaeon]